MRFRSSGARISTTLVVAVTLAVPISVGSLSRAATTTVIDGPDISHFQHPNGKAINWKSVAKAGKEFEISKATESTNFVDPYFTRDYAAAYQAGLVHGAYHFARPGFPILSTARAQAKYFWKTIDGSVQTVRTLPPALDLEVTGGLAPAQLVTWAQDFELEMRTLSGRTPMLYTYPSFWENDLADPTSLARFPLWMAEYGTSHAPVSNLWQYTDDAHIKGIPGAVDESTFTGSSGLPWATLSNGTVATPWKPAAPAAPVGVQAAAAGGNVTVSWLPGDAGTSRITGYTVTASPGGKTVSVGSATFQATFTGLSTTKAYTFTVTATNAIGTGAATAPTPPVVPTIPTTLAATVQHSLTYGSPLALQAKLSRADNHQVLPGQQVLIYRRTSGTSAFHLVRNLSTNAAGQVSTTLKPTKSAQLEVVFPGSLGISRATSYQNFVVRPTVSAVLSSGLVVHKHSVTLSGSASPFSAGQRVTREGYYGGAWHVWDRTKLNKHGQYTFTVTPTAKGRDIYRVVVSAGHGRAAGISLSRRLTVT